MSEIYNKNGAETAPTIDGVAENIGKIALESASDATSAFSEDEGILYSNNNHGQGILFATGVEHYHHAKNSGMPI